MKYFKSVLGFFARWGEAVYEARKRNGLNRMY